MALLIIGTIAVIIAYAMFRIGGQGDDLTDDQIIAMGDPRQADVLNSSFHENGLSG